MMSFLLYLFRFATLVLKALLLLGLFVCPVLTFSKLILTHLLGIVFGILLLIGLALYYSALVLVFLYKDTSFSKSHS